MWSVVSNTPWILDVRYPTAFDNVLAWISNLFSLDFVISADCVADRVGFKDTLLMHTIGPFVICALVLLTGWCYIRFSVYKIFTDIDEKKAAVKTMKISMTIVLFIIFMSYTTASTTIFQGIRPCHEFDENYHGSNEYMKDDYGTSCESSRHTFIRVWSWLMLFVYPIGIPVFTFLFLWRHRETLNPDVVYEVKDDAVLRGLGGCEISREDRENLELASCGTSCTEFSATRAHLAVTGQGGYEYEPLETIRKDVVKAKVARRKEILDAKEKSDLDGKPRALRDRPELFSFMYDNYEPEYWWFESLDYVRRLLLTGILVVLNQGSAAQGLFGVIVALGSTQVYSWTRPFVEDTGNILAALAQWSTFFTFLAALLILLDGDSDVLHRTVFAVLLIAIQFTPLVITASIHLIKRTKAYSDKKPAHAKPDARVQEADGIANQVPGEFDADQLDHTSDGQAI